MKYRRKPTEIEAVQVNNAWDVENLKDIFSINIRPYSSHDGGQDMEVRNELHETWIGFIYGAYLRIDNPEDIYPISEETFNETYELVTG